MKKLFVDPDWSRSRKLAFFQNAPALLRSLTADTNAPVLMLVLDAWKSYRIAIMALFDLSASETIARQACSASRFNGLLAIGESSAGERSTNGQLGMDRICWLYFRIVAASSWRTPDRSSINPQSAIALGRPLGDGLDQSLAIVTLKSRRSCVRRETASSIGLRPDDLVGSDVAPRRVRLNCERRGDAHYSSLDQRTVD